jgi:tetratricopeptide (TPR) repeat protein
MSLPPLDPSIPVPKLCLNMIVKNESKIIKRLLLSVSNLIDMYCICDTGSTDNTIEIIETFFKEKNIPGKVIEEPFQDFGYNRSYALKACESMDADYVLLLDADMVFWRNLSIEPANFKRYLTNFDLFFIYQGTDTFYYKNTRIVKNKKGFSYWGVTHEYVDCPPNTRSGQLDKDVCFIKDIGDGGSKTNKFKRDVALLKKGLETDPNNDRYTFYLANSLKDSGEKEEAIETYQKRIEIGGWVEEVWHSYYSMGRCYQEIGNMDGAIRSWMEGYDAFPNRVENLYEIVQHYRIIGKHKLAQLFYDLGQESMQKYKERDYLFLQKDVYDYKLDYEMTIFGYYHNPRQIDLAELSMRILAYPHIVDGIARNILSNYKFYSKRLDVENTHKWKDHELDRILQNMGSTLDIPSGKFPHFVPSTPTFCKHPNDSTKLFVIRRFVNYRINDQGGYENHEYIETKNVCMELQYTENSSSWTVVKECFLDYKNEYDNRYVGLEDVRIMSFDNQIYYTANRGLSGNKMVIEHGIIDTTRFITEHVKHLEYDHQRQIEKNWVMFEENNVMKMVYNWYPMVIGIVEDTKFKTTNTIKTPYLFRFLRGSTNGISVGNEIWFLCHVVSYEDRRYYYHIIVMMDKTTHALKYTRMFTLEQEKVEYSLGFLYQEDSNELWIGYSLMDRETKYMSIQKSTIRNMIVNE